VRFPAKVCVRSDKAWRRGANLAQLLTGSNTAFSRVSVRLEVVSASRSCADTVFGLRRRLQARHPETERDQGARHGHGDPLRPWRGVLLSRHMLVNEGRRSPKGDTFPMRGGV